jgi:hypothetical protein
MPAQGRATFMPSALRRLHYGSSLTPPPPPQYSIWLNSGGRGALMGGSVWVNPKPSVPPQRGVLCPPGFSAYIMHSVVSPRLTYYEAASPEDWLCATFTRSNRRTASGPAAASPVKRRGKNRTPPRLPLSWESKLPMMKNPPRLTAGRTAPAEKDLSPKPRRKTLGVQVRHGTCTGQNLKP